MAFTIPTELQLNLGSYPNDGTGDDLYTAFNKVKGSFDLISDGIDAVTGQNLGTGTEIYVDNTSNILQFKTLTSTKLTISNTSTSVNIEGLGQLSDDTSPRLGGTLSLNSNDITGTGNITINGSVNALVWGIDIRDLQAQVDAGGGGGGADVDFGSFDAPNPNDIDFGTFI